MISDYIIKKFISRKEGNKSRNHLGELSGYVGILCNLIIAIGKFFAGIVTSSIAISADAFNNLSDAISSVVTLICFKTSGNPADKNHPFGYGRVEYISGLIVSIAIIFMGIEFTKSSIEKMFNPEPISIGALPVTILILSLILKLWLGVFNKKIGEIISSTAIKAAAFDSLGDSIVTATILIGMLVTYFTGTSVDSYSGIIVALFIIFTGVSMIKETLRPLIGESPSPEFVKKINDLILSSPDIIGVHGLIVHNYGPNKSVISAHAEMPAEKSIMELHEAVDIIENKLKKNFNCDAIIHIDPIVTDDLAIKETRDKISKLVTLVHKDAKVYDLRIVPGDIITLIFHISIPYDVSQSNDEIIKSVTANVKEIDKNYDCIIEIDRIYF